MMFRIKKIADDGIRIGKTLFSFVFHCQWGDLLKIQTSDWTGFTFVQLDVECGTGTGTYWEIHAALLGVHLHIDIIDAGSRREFSKDMEVKISEMLDRIDETNATGASDEE